MEMFSTLYEKAMSAYDTALKAGLKFPFVKVNKERFLRRKLGKTLSDEELDEALTGSPLTVCPLEKIEKMAKHEVWRHAFWVFLLSFVAAIPTSGWLMWLAIVLDFIQFQLFVFVILQKILYLYGCKNLRSGKDDIDGSADWMLLLVSTVMIGKHQAVRMAKSAMGVAAKQAVQRFALRMMTKMLTNNVVRQCAKWCGIVLTKEMVVGSLEYVVPFLCALISGLISLWLFLPMTKRLVQHLTQLAKDGKNPMESELSVV